MKTFNSFLLLICLVFPNLWAQPILELEEYASGFSFPVDIANVNDDRLFVLERKGVIRIIDGSGTVLSTPFLNIENKVEHFNSAAGEIGLLGIAFHPNYADNGYFYLNYINNDFNTTVSRFQVSGTDPNVADPNSETIILDVTQPFLNHNGGCLKFGPDGYLYIGLGDGGSAGDPMAHAQNRLSLLGKMLRIDINNGDPYAIPADNPFADDDFTLDEIWAIGLRNPWRFSFDRELGDMWIGDVGQGQWEEIDFEAAGSPGGLNYGWRCMEGNSVYNDANCEDPSTFTMPAEAYLHTGHCSVTGGYVYRGSEHPSMQGYYLYTDYCSGQFWSLKKDGMGGFESNEAGSISGFSGSTFGEDHLGEMYVAHLTNGRIYKIGLDVCSEFSLSGNMTNETCDGDGDGAIDLNLNNGLSPFVIEWSNGPTTEDISDLIAGVYTVTVTDSQDCERIQSFEIENQSPGTFSIAANGPISFCEGSNVMLTASTIPAGYTYQWYEGNNLLMGQTQATLEATSSGDYYVTLIGPCEVSMTSNWINVMVEPVPSPFVSAVDGFTGFCVGDTVLIATMTAPQGYEYKWYLEGVLIEGATDSVLAVTLEGNYYVILNNDVCESNQSNWLFIDEIGPNLFSNDEPEICSGVFDLSDLTIVDLNNAGGTMTYHSGSPADESNLLDDLSVSLMDTTTFYVLSSTEICMDELPITINVFPQPEMPIIVENMNGTIGVPDVYESYQWYYQGSPIEGETMPFHAPGIKGVYMVLVTDANGCFIFSDEYEETVSNRDLARELLVKLSPNPFSDHVVVAIETELAQELTIQLIDVLGRTLRSEKHQVAQVLSLELTLDDLASGLYFLSIDNGSGSLVRKLVKR